MADLLPPSPTQRICCTARLRPERRALLIAAIAMGHIGEEMRLVALGLMSIKDSAAALMAAAQIETAAKGRAISLTTAAGIKT